MTDFEQDKAKVAELANTAMLKEAEKKDVEAIYEKVYKEPLPNCNCTNKWADAIVKLQLWFRQHNEYITTRYSIQRGVVFLLDGVAVSAMNLTDEYAERLLAENPQAAKYITERPQTQETAKKAAKTETNKKK